MMAQDKHSIAIVFLFYQEDHDGTQNEVEKKYLKIKWNA
jgi:hypothetical protein